MKLLLLVIAQCVFLVSCSNDDDTGAANPLLDLQGDWFSDCSASGWMNNKILSKYESDGTFKLVLYAYQHEDTQCEGEMITEGFANSSLFSNSSLIFDGALVLLEGTYDYAGKSETVSGIQVNIIKRSVRFGDNNMRSFIARFFLRVEEGDFFNAYYTDGTNLYFSNASDSIDNETWTINFDDLLVKE